MASADNGSPCQVICPEGKTLKITFPDDFHHHFRDESRIKTVLSHASRRFGRCIAMPNTKPPITTTKLALEYRERILDSLEDKESGFIPLMTLYLTDNTTPEEIRKAHATGHIYAAKYYPAGATTNSDFGVTHLTKTYDALRAMEEVGMILAIHSEVSRAEIDIFDRETVFIEEVMVPLVRDFPNLKVVMEHISTKGAVEFINKQKTNNVRASITAHHLLYNRNAILVGGIKPHFYCLPILKREIHRQALLSAATSGSPKFFAGTDSAPHSSKDKESACGCAGVYTAHAAVELYAEAFESMGAIDRLDAFFGYGVEHYGLKRNERQITLVKKSWDVPESYTFGEDIVKPLRGGERVHWTIID